MNLLLVVAMSTDRKTESFRSILLWPLATLGGHYAGGVGAPITVFNPQDARNWRCQLCLQMCRSPPLPMGSRGFAKSDDTRGSGNLYVPPSGLSPNPTGDIRPGHEPQITCERVCALTLTLWCHAGTDRRVTEHRDRRCRTHWGQGTEHGPPRSSFAGGPVPRGWGSARTPFRDALCISTHRPGLPTLPPTQIPVPGSRERGATGVAVGHVLPLSRRAFP